MAQPVFDRVFPISGEVMALPVSAIGPAVGYYVNVLGFSLVSKAEDTATLIRDNATIGLAVSEEDPEAVSCGFSVRNLDALRDEYIRKGIEPSPVRVDEYSGKRYRVFFAKEPYGVCFCFSEPA